MDMILSQGYNVGMRKGYLRFQVTVSDSERMNVLVGCQHIRPLNRRRHSQKVHHIFDRLYASRRPPLGSE